MNEKEFNGLILAELVKIANDVFTNEIEIAPDTYTAAELAKLKDTNGNEINIKYLCVDAKLNITDFKKQTFICDFAGYFPNYRLVYPNLSKDGFIKIQKSELKAVAGFVKEIAKRNKKSGFSLRTIARENKVYLSYNDADSNGHKELCVTLEKAALIDIKLGFFASNVIPLLSGWTGGVWLVAPDRAAVFDDKAARIGVVMPAFINDSICPNLKCNIKALDRAKVPTIPEKESVREPEKHLPALYVDVQTKTPAFVFALVALIDFISRWFYQDQINKALQRLTMLTELSGISLPELLTEPVNEETNANEPEPITENEPVRAYTPELLYIDQPLVFPVPIFIHKHERTISPTVVPELLNRQCITLLFVSMMLPELLRRYVWGAIRPKANADELFWGDFRRFHTKGNHRIRDGTKEANKPKLQPFQTNYYIHQESLWKRINKPKEVIAETNRLRKVRSMLLDWILIWLILSESNRT
nr:MAG: hypothetical protein [Bacteriophage sp.]